jgi:hypothetical protein
MSGWETIDAYIQIIRWRLLKQPAVSMHHRAIGDNANLSLLLWLQLVSKYNCIVNQPRTLPIQKRFFASKA